MNDLISVIVPVYNTYEFLRQCIDSIRLQTYHNLEIILIDDGSSDGSEKICDDYVSKDRRIKVIHQKNQGLVQSRKNGLEAAKGKYIGFVDSDDWIDPQMYQYLYDVIKQTGADVVSTGRYLEKSGNSEKLPDHIEPGLYCPKESEYFCKHMIFGDNRTIWGITPNFWNKLFKKENISEWEKTIPPDITYGEDDACVYSCMAFADSVYTSKKCFYHYRLRKNSMSNSADEQYFSRINLLYLTLLHAFEKHPKADVLLRELSVYMFQFALRGINGLWGLKTNLCIPHRWMDFSIFLKNRRLLLYGAGNVGKDYYRQLYFMGLDKNIVWVDIRGAELRKEGYPVFQPEEISISEIDQVIVAIEDEKIADEIRKEFQGRGIPCDKIDWKKPRDILEQEVAFK